MGFKSSEELKAMSNVSIYKCDDPSHEPFMCEMADRESIQKHLADYPHTISGTAPCVRCGKDVKFGKNSGGKDSEGNKLEDKPSIKKPVNEGQAPGAFCDDCKEELKKELFPNE